MLFHKFTFSIKIFSANIVACVKSKAIFLNYGKTKIMSTTHLLKLFAPNSDIQMSSKLQMGVSRNNMKQSFKQMSHLAAFQKKVQFSQHLFTNTD